ncbi:probable carboxylesterase 12 [Cornus florida]|uniref:probable carboxylesterase 12 n=1 Tax=Cornus florida TaxID=4283 RepID=UPI002898E929|nr:probable carboxylesterase 12 [Cornus florida]
MESSPRFQFPIDNKCSDTITHDFSPFFRVHNDGRIERFKAPEFAPPSDDPNAGGVRSKDIVISPETGVSVRVYIPQTTNPDHKFPLLVYIHGGGFCLGSASSPTFHNFVNSLVAEAKVVAVSVDYRLAPEHHLPIAHEDSWAALKWVVSHSSGQGPEPWLNSHANFQRVFVAGESAGANIANEVVIRAGVGDELNGVKIVGLLLVQPFFGTKEADKMYQFMCPSSSGSDDDPRLNPAVDPRLPRLGCRRVLFCIAEKDFLRDRGWGYYEALKKSGWGGELESMETEGEGHGFHLFNQSCDKAVTLLNRLASFLNKD